MKVDNPENLKWLEYKLWSLNEALCLVKGLSPYHLDSDTRVHTETNISNIRSYKLAEAAIRCGDLSAYSPDETKNPFSHLHMGMPCVDSREFIAWAVITIPIESTISGFFDYTYWVEKEWSFDEAVTLLVRGDCPLPHEVTNVFECDDTYKIAVEFHNYLHGYDHYAETGSRFIDKIEIVEPHELKEWAKQKNLPLYFPDWCTPIFELRKDTKKTRVCNPIYDEWLNLDYWSLEEAKFLLFDICPTYSDIGVMDGVYNKGVSFSEYKYLHQLIYRACVSRSFSLLNDAFEIDNKNEFWPRLIGAVKPREFLTWAKGKGVNLPDGFILEIVDSNPDAKTTRTLSTAIHRERARAIAEMVWSRDESITIAQMCISNEVTKYGCEGKLYAEKTLRKWIGDLHPAPLKGRPRKGGK